MTEPLVPPCYHGDGESELAWDGHCGICTLAALERFAHANKVQAEEILELRESLHEWMAHHLHYHKDCRERFFAPERP